MLVCRTRGLPLVVALSVAPTVLNGQTATAPLTVQGTPLAPNPSFRHHKELRAVYDSLVDSTQVSVVTHKGKYFLTMQRPRLTWSAAYAGHAPEAPPQEVMLEFRTQSPQIALDSRLTIESSTGLRLEVASAGAHSKPGVQTWSHFIRFSIPCGELARVLAGDRVTVTVGGISERLKAEHLNAVRDLLNRVGA